MSLSNLENRLFKIQMKKKRKIAALEIKVAELGEEIRKKTA